MSLKHILADLGGQATDDLVLELAWQIAALDNAHINVLHMRRDRGLAAPDGIDSGIDRLMSQIDGLVAEGQSEDGYDAELASRESRAHAALQNFLTRRGVTLQEQPGPQQTVTASWRVERTSNPAALTHLARVCDLTVMIRPSLLEIDLSDDAESVLLGAGRPLLFAPATEPRQLLHEILVAWDGSREATRAVGMALPLLARAGSVRIFTRAGEASTDHDEAGLVRYLARHGITAEIASAARPDLPIAEDLLATCRSYNVSLLVMGAYGRSRTREAIFGGTSEHMIEHALLPVLMVP